VRCESDHDECDYVLAPKRYRKTLQKLHYGIIEKAYIITLTRDHVKSEEYNKQGES